MNKKILSVLIAFAIIFAFLPRLQVTVNVLNHFVEHSISKFLIVGGDYYKLNSLLTIPGIAQEIKTMIPAESKVGSTKITDFQKSQLIFTLYPIQLVEKDWDYYIDFNQSVIYPPRDWRVLKLPMGARIFDKGGKGFLLKKELKPYPLKRNFIIFLIVTLFLGYLGSLVLKLLNFKSGQLGGQLGHLSFCYLLGTGIWNAGVWIIMLFGILIDKTVLLIYGGTLLGMVHLIPKRDQPKQLAQSEKSLKGQNKFRILPNVAGIASFIFVCLLLVVTGSIPISVTDEFAHWIIKAKFIYYQGSFDYTLTELYNYYPPLWPLHISTHLLAFNGDYPEVSKWVSALSLFCFFVQFKIGTKNKGISGVAEWVRVAIFVLVFFNWIIFTGLPENLFLAYLTAGVVMLIEWLKKPADNRYYVLSVILVWMMGMVKFEGTVCAVLIGIALFLTNWGSISLKRNIMRSLPYFLVIFIIIGWRAWLNWQGQPAAVYHLHVPFNMQKIIDLLSILAGNLKSHHVGLLFLYFIIYLVYCKKDVLLSQQGIFLSFLAMGLILFSIFAGIGWPQQDLLQYYSEVSQRLFLKAAPVLAILGFKLIYK